MQEKILVGHKLRRFRQSAGLSQTAMAEALDISPSTCTFFSITSGR